MLIGFYRRCFISIHISLKFVPKDLIDNVVSVSDSGITPCMGQAIIWTNAGHFTDAYKSLGRKDLNNMTINYTRHTAATGMESLALTILF